MTFVNTSAYQFVDLTRLGELKQQLRDKCVALELKGTILLAQEGINIMLAGSAASIEEFKSYLAQDARFQDLFYKDSVSEVHPFQRMLVKIKKEIITMGVPHIRPVNQRAPTITPEELKNWLDAGKDFILLDTRNDYEVAYGAFTEAKHLNIQHFRHFPQAIKEQLQDVKNKPIVTYCTGGVRCEKAAWLMSEEGFQEVYQLDGGILNYFIKEKSAHYTGDCFVFDDRIAVTPELEVAVNK